MRALLWPYSPVEGFAYGWFGEAPSNVHSLLKVVAGKIATDNWMNQCDANAALVSRFGPEDEGIGNARGIVPRASQRRLWWWLMIPTHPGSSVYSPDGVQPTQASQSVKPLVPV